MKQCINVNEQDSSEDWDWGSEQPLSIFFILNGDTVSNRACSAPSGMRSLPPSSRSSSSLVALPASSILQRHCHIRQACPATLSIPLVSQTNRQNRPYAFIEAPHPPSFLHLPHCLIPLSSVSGNPAGRCSTAQPGTNSQP